MTPRLMPLKSAGDLISGMLGGDELDLARRTVDLHDGLDELALRLQVDAMVVEAADALHGASEQFVLGIDARRLGEELDVKALLLEVAEPLREHERQIDLLLQAADHDGDLVGRPGLACRNCKAGGEAGGAYGAEQERANVSNASRA